MPKIEILLATYNSGKYMRQLIQSLLGQTYTDWRILAHDDGSSDATVEILKEYQDKFPEKVWLVNDGVATGGSANNFSHLAGLSTADYVMFCDQDDVWMPEKIERTFKRFLQVEKDCGPEEPILVHTDLSVVGPSLETISDSFWKYQNLNPEVSHKFGALLMQNVVTGCTVMVNRPLLRLAMPFPPEAIMHDWWLALVAAAFGRVEYLSEPTILYRQHGGNTVGAKRWGGEQVFHRLSGILKHEAILVSIRRNVSQASAFHARYAVELDNEKRCAVKACADIFTYGWFSRRRIVLQYGLFKCGFIRNVGLFIGI